MRFACGGCRCEIERPCAGCFHGSYLALYSNRELETSNQSRLTDRPDGHTGVGSGLRDAVRFRSCYPRRGAPWLRETLRRRAGDSPFVWSAGAQHLSHNCSDHDAATRVAATTTAARANSVPEPSLLAAIPLHDSISNLADSDVVLDYRPPPGSPPLTASPLVLRV